MAAEPVAGVAVTGAGVSESCLLIVDVQAGFLTKATRHIPASVEAAQAGYEHVVATRFFNPENSFFRTLLDWDRCAPGSPDIPLAFEARPDALILDKPGYTCVSAEFLAWLREHNISVVHVCGIETDICVTQCAVNLFESGIEPVVLGGLCASCAGKAAHARGLATLARYIGRNQIR